jgi:hypothetical protein
MPRRASLSALLAQCSGIGQRFVLSTIFPPIIDPTGGGKGCQPQESSIASNIEQ